MVVVLAEGAADQGRAHAGEPLDHIVALVHVRHDLVSGQRIVMVVLAGMVHQLMSMLDNGFRRIRILLRPRSDHKERRLDVVFVQHVEDLLRVVRSPGRRQRAATALQMF